MLFASTAFIWLRSRIKGKALEVFLNSLAFLTLFVPTALRYGVGTDFFSYYRIYNYPELHRKMELGFAAINSTLRNFDLSAQWGMAAYAFIFFWVSIRSYPKNNPWIFHIIFVSSLLFFSFNGIRQAIAVSFISLSILYFINHKTIRSIILIIIGSLFHKSTLIAIPAIALYYLPAPRSIETKTIPLVMLTVVFLSILFGSSLSYYIEVLSGYLNLPYNHYFESSYFAQRRVNTGVILISKCLSIAFILFYSERIINLNKRYWLIIILTCFYLLFYSLSYHSAAYGRMAYTFLIGPLYLIYLSLNYSKKNINLQFLISVAALILFVTPFLMSTLSAESNPNSDTAYKSIIE